MGNHVGRVDQLLLPIEHGDNEGSRIHSLRHVIVSYREDGAQVASLAERERQSIERFGKPEAALKP